MSSVRFVFLIPWMAFVACVHMRHYTLGVAAPFPPWDSHQQLIVNLSNFKTNLLACLDLASPQTSFGARLSRIHFSPTYIAVLYKACQLIASMQCDIFGMTWNSTVLHYIYVFFNLVYSELSKRENFKIEDTVKSLFFGLLVLSCRQIATEN